MFNQYYYKATITEAYDGDTVTAIVDLGFNISSKIKLRLLGIDTPEIRGEERPEGLIARDYVRDLLLNKEVMIETFKDRTGKYGRMLATIYIDGININEHLVKEGYAEIYKK